MNAATQIFSKVNVGPNDFCDGLYVVKIAAFHSTYPNDKKEYTATISAKYKCSSLQLQGKYFRPDNSVAKFTAWPGGSSTEAIESTTLSFRIGDAATDLVHPLIHNTPYVYSC